MGLTERLSRHAGIQIHRVGSLRLIHWEDVPKFLDSCLAEEVMVLGLDGFHWADEQIRPQMDLIADFSALSEPREAVLEAKAFVETADRPGVYYEVTLAD